MYRIAANCLLSIIVVLALCIAALPPVYALSPTADISKATDIAIGFPVTTQLGFEEGIVGSELDSSTAAGDVQLGTRSDWYNNGWIYRKPITVTNGSGGSLTDYQVKVTLNTQELISAAKMQSDGDDLRFTQSNGTTLIDYWIESGINTTSTEIWVNVPSIPTGDSTIYVYYGNSSATAASSLSSTFPDSFSGTYAGWDYRRAIEITETSGSTLTNFQVLMTLNTTTFDYSKVAGLNGEDLRFNSGGTACDYWIETWNASGTSEIWVEVPSLATSSTTTIYMYFGNAAASAGSNFDNTFTKNYGEAGLAGLWHMDDASGTTVVDSSGNGNNATIINAVQWAASDGGQWDSRSDVHFSTGDSLTFNGETTMDDLVATGYNPAGLSIAGDVTISVWVKPGTATGNYETLVSKREQDTLDTNYEIYLAPGSRAFSYFDGTERVGTFVPPTGQWSHLVAVVNDAASQVKLYANGTLRDTLTGNTNILGDDPLRFGADACWWWFFLELRNENYSGTMDEVRVYNRTLNEDEITCLYERRKYASSDPTVNLGTEESPTSWTDYFVGTAGISSSTNVTVSGGAVSLNASQIETLRPNGVGSETAIYDVLPVSTPHWQTVYDVVPDDDTSYVVQRTIGEGGIWRRDLYSIPDHSAGSGAVTKITVYFRVKEFQNSSYQGQARASIRTNAQTYDGTTEELPWDTWTNLSYAWTVNPSTSSAWTWSEIDALEIGVSLRNNGDVWGACRVAATQVYVVVEYRALGDITSVTIPTDTSTRLAVGSQLSWNDSEPSGTDIKYQVYYLNGTWQLIPDADLSGNSTGFDTSPVDISSLKTDYGQIRLKANLTSTGSTTPTVSDWTVTYYCRKYTSTEPIAGAAGAEEVRHFFGGILVSKVFDTGKAGASWLSLSWTKTLPANTQLILTVRASDISFTKDAVSPSWTAVGQTSPVSSGLPSGQYMQWGAIFTTSGADTSVLHDVRITYS